MTKWLTLPLALLCALAGAQVPVVPTSRPHQNFVDGVGAPCAGCSLYSYIAGTTTPQPTYTDSSGTSQNTNPIVLDVAGGANIWMGTALTYKFVLKDTLGSTIWTVDNVKGAGGGAVPCSTPFTVQFANSDATALACDSTITIDPTAHSLNIGGKITGPAASIKTLGTVASSWTLDVTSPTTALNSLGAIPLGNLAPQNPDTVAMNASGSTAPPTPVALPAGCTNGVNYDTTTHAWTCANTIIPLSSLAAQAADTVVMNATGSNIPPTAYPLPTGCTNGVNYSTSTHAWTCTPRPPVNPTFSDITYSRAFGVTYQNTNTNQIIVHASGVISGSYGQGFSISCEIGASSSSLVFMTTGAVHNDQGIATVSCEVPAGYFYEVYVDNTNVTNPQTPTLTHWVEMVY